MSSKFNPPCITCATLEYYIKSEYGRLLRGKEGEGEGMGRGRSGEGKEWGGGRSEEGKEWGGGRSEEGEGVRRGKE